MQRVRTFANQGKLPRLPIPPLKESASRYLRSIQPLQTPQAHAQTEALVTDFIRPGGLGETLQQRLVEYEKKQPNSWLEDWWLKMAYHTWRESSMINSNWFLLMKYHPEHKESMLQADSIQKNAGKFTDFQVYRSAGIISGLLDYKDLIDKEELEPEMTKTGPVCMDQYRRMFSVTRVPLAGCDRNDGVHPSPHRHINVIVRDQVYSVDVYDGVTGGRLPIKAIEQQLKTVVENVGKTMSEPSVCLFTSEHRDNWSKSYKTLLELNPINRESMRNVETSLFTICLDDYAVQGDWVATAKNVFHGKGGHNRWFDKCICVVVQNDGRAGCNGEHSPLDALVPAFMFDYIAKRQVFRHELNMSEPIKDPKQAVGTYHLNPPKKLKWVLNEQLEQDLKKAQVAADALIANSDLDIVHFKEYGMDFVKKVAKVSPDAYMQMSLQLAYYKLHGKFAPVYETSSTRQFLHGRTETCRSLSNDQAAFVKGFLDPQLSALEKYKLLQKACTSHIEYIQAASNGKGCDRHMLGLRLCMKEGESAGIFTDPIFRESVSFRLSTSQLFPTKNITATGFGAVVSDLTSSNKKVPDGYGMNYIFENNMIKMGVESKVSCKETSTQKFKETLMQVWRDMKTMCESIDRAKL